MRSTLPATLPLLLFVALTPARAQEQDPRVWLERMGQSVERLNYDGVFVHIHDREVETMRVIHRVDGDRVSERLIVLNGAGREIIRNNDEVRCTLARERAVVIERRRDQSPLRAALPAYSRALDRYYELLHLGRERVAELDARIIHIRPRDAYRYGYRLWLEEATAMPLKSDLIAETGETVEQIMFTTIRINVSIPDSALRPALPVEGYKRYTPPDEPMRIATAASRWIARDLPPGFTLSASRRDKMAGREALVEHLVFTDGLASVSVFIEPSSGGAEELGSFHLGATNAFATLIDEHQVTAVGEAPMSTVKMIGNAVTMRPESASP